MNILSKSASYLIGQQECVGKWILERLRCHICQCQFH
jgi:hypothetical protein